MFPYYRRDSTPSDKEKRRFDMRWNTGPTLAHQRHRIPLVESLKKEKRQSRNLSGVQSWSALLMMTYGGSKHRLLLCAVDYNLL